MSALGWAVVGATDVAVVALLLLAAKLPSRRLILLLTTAVIGLSGNALVEVVFASDGAAVWDTVIWQSFILVPSLVIFSRAVVQDNQRSANDRSEPGGGW